MGREAVRRVPAAAWAVLPHGRLLPEETWRHRHRLIVWFLALHAPAVLAFGWLRGFPLEHAAAEAAVPLLAAALATLPRLRRSVRSCLAAGGLMVTSAIFVHLSGGTIEAHFYFFVLIPIVALYEDWLPFGLAVSVVLLHHGVMGTIDPRSVFDHADAWRRPWLWAGIHAGLFGAACVGSVLNWRLHEQARVAERELMAEVTWQARHDQLTGLSNRREFERWLSAAVQESREAGRQHVLCFVDLDRFKLVNDTCGHVVGDELLRQVATRLRASVRAADVLARLGGDEFAVLLRGCSPAAAQARAEALRAAVESLEVPSGRRPFAISASIGLAVVAGDPADPDELLHRADVACYAAKAAGRNAVRWYEPADDHRERQRDDLALLALLRQALAGDGFELYLQPIAAVAGDHPLGRRAEFLLRLRHGERLLLPGEFLPVAERYDLMPAVDRWVVEHAVAELAGRYPTGYGGPDLYSVNLSGASLADNVLLDVLREALNGTGLPASLLCFELTETVAVANIDRALHVIRELRRLGCRFALDDFGSGMSSFGYLKTLPVDLLKVDGSFVRNLATDRFDQAFDQAMVAAVIEVGHTLGIGIVAEYVESEEILDQVRALGADFAQGYRIGRPAPAAQFFLPASREPADVG